MGNKIKSIRILQLWRIPCLMELNFIVCVMDMDLMDI